jgi:hypothetical protein
MADIFNTTHVALTGATVTHHCEHGHGRSSWRLESVDGGSDALYFTGTVTELKAFGESVLRAAEAFRVERQAFKKELCNAD